MMNSLLEDAGLSPEVCASLLGVNPKSFALWARGDRELPGFIAPELASVLGVSKEDLLANHAVHAPAIWYKFRSEQTSIADRELVVLIRRLGFYACQLNSLTGQTGNKWRIAFSVVRHGLDEHKRSAPSVQGGRAATLFRDFVNLGFSRDALNERISGPGDIIRGVLRSLGVLIIEMPIPESQMDGCSFYVGHGGEETPCLFINTYRQRWFRRNYVLAHELAHAIFDIDDEAALIDYRKELGQPSLREARADAFARNCFASARTLQVETSKLGLNWGNLTPLHLAQLVAHCQVELKTILRTAEIENLITAEQALCYSKHSLKKELRSLSERVLTANEYFDKHPENKPWIGEYRETTIPSRKLRLPIPYITSVLSAVNSCRISEGRAAEMLMMDRDTFIVRFGHFLEEIAA